MFLEILRKKCCFSKYHKNIIQFKQISLAKFCLKPKVTFVGHGQNWWNALWAFMISLDQVDHS